MAENNQQPSGFRPPKQETLTEDTTISKFYAWQSSLLFYLSQNKHYAQFLEPTATWQRKSVTNRGLVNDQEPIPEGDRKTAVQKNIALERMLAIIAQFCPALLRNDIIKKSTSVSWIWQRIRKHYSFSQSEVNFLKISEIRREPNERYETLFQRIVAHLDDNLLTTTSNITYEGAAITADEEMTPSLERLAVYLWLNLIDVRLPAYISRVYAHDLALRSLKDIQPQICEAMNSLLSELNSQDDNITVNYSRSVNPRRTFNNNNTINNNNNNNTRGQIRNSNNNSNNNFNPRNNYTPRSNTSNPRRQFSNSRNPIKQCILCKAAGKAFQGHDIATCWFISKFDKLEIVDAFQLNVSLNDNTELCEEDESNLACHEEQFINAVTVEPPQQLGVSSSVRRVSVAVSPFFFAFYEHHTVKVLVDSGATSSLISRTFAVRVGLNIQPTQHGAKQLDKSFLSVQGEVKFVIVFGDIELKVDGLINDSLDYDILAGVPFCMENGVDVLMSRELISIQGKLIPYGSKPESIQHSIYRSESVILRNDKSRVLYPGEFLEVSSDNLHNYDDEEVSIEPRVDSPLQGSWPPPAVSRVIQGSVRIPNRSNEPVYINKCQHFAQIRRIVTSDILATRPSSPINHPDNASRAPIITQPATPFSSAIGIDPDKLLQPDMRQKFREVQRKWDGVFNPRFGKYNGASGPFIGEIKFGNVEPPPTKPKMPFYNSSNLRQLQEEADKLEELGVLVKPEDVGVDVKFASPSFLRLKPSGAFRYITSFTELAQYIRTLPVANVSADRVIRELAKWKYVIKTDLTQSFFQIPISKKSMPYLATSTPFKGLRVYTTPVMGMPGSSEILQELMSRIFGNEMMEGWLLIIADDMYVCANSLDDLLVSWDVVLEKMSKNGLSLSATKTIVCPKSFDVLGWKWNSGTITITPHKVTPLISSDPPKTCSNMRSYIGTFKAMSRCIPGYSSLMSPLEESIKGLAPSQHIQWTAELLAHFNRCKEALKSPVVLTMPTPEDKLILTVDASPVNAGIGATLYVCRDGKRLISDCFSMKLKIHHLKWEPCELEALAIASGIQHFSPFITESKHPLEVLTDNRPCVQAFAKLRKGHFSASARVSTFLSTLSQHSIIMSHLKGTNNMTSDYASRNPNSCSDSCCQICKFVEELSNSVVRQLTVQDVLSGAVRMPYLNKVAWQAAQQNDSSLRRVHAHLEQGTRPSKKAKRSREVKRYLSMCSFDNHGLIIVKKPDPYLHERELIVVPDEILPGLLTALHIQFNHPTKYQLGKLFERHFYAISSQKVIENVVGTCNQCNALKLVNRELFEQTSSTSPTRPGECFAADIIQRSKQKIFATRDVHTSYTTASLVPNQTADTLRMAILDGTSLMRLPACTIRIDNAPGFLPLKNDAALASRGISLDFGQIKNANRNPVAEKSNRELELELLRLDPTGSPISQSLLQEALKNLNMRIRNRNLSSQEMLFCRDQSTGKQLTVDDAALSEQQQFIREQNHLHSSRSKARGAASANNARIAKGDLVYIKSEGSKNKSRDMYLVTDVMNNMAAIQKLYGSTFQSRRYEVPLNRIFHAVKPGNQSGASDPPTVLDSSSSSDDECPIPPAVVRPPDRNDDSTDSSSSDCEVVVPPRGQFPSLRRSRRRHRSPPRLIKELFKERLGRGPR